MPEAKSVASGTKEGLAAGRLLGKAHGQRLPLGTFRFAEAPSQPSNHQTSSRTGNHPSHSAPVMRAYHAFGALCFAILCCTAQGQSSSSACVTLADINPDSSWGEAGCCDTTHSCPSACTSVSISIINGYRTCDCRGCDPPPPSGSSGFVATALMTILALTTAIHL